MPYWILIILAFNYQHMTTTYIPFDTEKDCIKASENIKNKINEIPNGVVERKPAFILTCLPTGR